MVSERVHLSRFTQAQQDYLKVLYHLEEEQRPVSTGAIAKRLDISSASVSEMIARLSEHDLVVHDRHRGQRLTKEGRQLALELIRHHRLIESFLVEILGYSADEVHEEAERLEHVISERMEERIFELLGHPELDPHGHAIPSREGELQSSKTRPLSECQAGDEVVVRSVSDAHPERLREFQRRNLMPGAQMKILASSTYESPIEARRGQESISVPLGLAREILVEDAANAGK